MVLIVPAGTNEIKYWIFLHAIVARKWTKIFGVAGSYVCECLSNGVAQQNGMSAPLTSASEIKREDYMN